MRYDIYFAQTYGACSYGGSSYQNSGCQTAATTPANGSGSSSASPLTNTGFDILLVATIACALIFVALIVRFWRRPKKPQTGTDPRN